MEDDQKGETRLAERMLEFIDEEYALQVVEGILRYLKERNKSASDLVEKMGLEEFKEAVTGGGQIRVDVKEDVARIEPRNI